MDAVFTESFSIVNQTTELFVFAPLKFIVFCLKATLFYIHLHEYSHNSPSNVIQPVRELVITIVRRGPTLSGVGGL